MTVQQFDPSNSSQANDIAKETTTLESPKKVLEEQASHVDHSQTKGSRIGFVSLGCLR